MKKVSNAYAMIHNINNIVKCHEDTCMSEDCGVSFYLLKETARFLLPRAHQDEMPELVRIIKEMPL